MSTKDKGLTPVGEILIFKIAHEIKGPSLIQQR